MSEQQQKREWDRSRGRFVSLNFKLCEGYDEHGTATELDMKMALYAALTYDEALDVELWLVGDAGDPMLGCATARTLPEAAMRWALVRIGQAAPTAAPEGLLVERDSRY